MYYTMTISRNSTESLRMATHILVVRREPVEDARGQNDQVTLLDSDPDPFIVQTSYVKEAIAINNVAYFFVFVEMLIEKGCHFGFIRSSHVVRRDNNFISISVRALRSNLVHQRNRRAVVVQNTQPC